MNPDPQTTLTPGALSAEAFDQQFRASWRPLWCIAAGVLGARDGADDVVQDAGLAAWERRDAFEPGTNFNAWLAEFVRLTALNHLRRRQKSPRALEPADEPTAPPPTAAQLAHDVEPDAAANAPLDLAAFDDEVLRGLHSLTPEARTCLLLKTVLDYPYSQIAPLLGIPEGTAMAHVHRARRHLLERLAPSPSCARPHRATS